VKLDVVSALYGLEPGGGEISTRILATELVGLGVDVNVVSSRREAAAEPAGVILSELAAIPWQAVLYAPNRMLDSLFRHAFIRRWLERKPDVVLIEDQLSIVGAVEAVEWLRRRGMRIGLAMSQLWEVDAEFFLEFRTWPISALLARRLQVANRYAKRMDFVNACTAYIRGRVIDRLGVPPEKVGVYYTIAVQQTELPESAPPARPLLLAPGRVNPEKGSFFFLDVVRELAQRRRDFQALFLGGGPHERKLRNAIVRSGLSEICSVTGKIPHEQFVRHYARASVVAAPIMYPCGYTRVVLESLCAGKPVVTFDQGSMPEIITNNRTGYLVRPRSVADFAAACERFIDDPALGARMAGECRTTGASHADVATAARGLLEALTGVSRLQPVVS
jgi:glycosyltransferase involved in cell wall biosynthesis